MVEINAVKKYNKLLDRKMYEQLLETDIDSIVFLERIFAVKMLLDNNTPIEIKNTLSKCIIFSEIDTIETPRGYNALEEVVISLEETFKINLLTNSNIFEKIRIYNHLEDQDDIKETYEKNMKFLSLNEEDKETLKLKSTSQYIKKKVAKKEKK